jgi:hypothetical protein
MRYSWVRRETFSEALFLFLFIVVSEGVLRGAAKFLRGAAKFRRVPQLTKE